MESLFERGGAWAIVLTRSLPYSMAEAMVFLAGLAGMPIGKYTAALTLGSVPTAFVFAAIGAGWADQPVLALALSYAAPHPLAAHRALSHPAARTLGGRRWSHFLRRTGYHFGEMLRRHTVLQNAAARDTWPLRGGAMLSLADATDIHADTFDLPPEAMREGFNDVAPEGDTHEEASFSPPRPP